MPNQDKHSKSSKSLGWDPFADLDLLEFEATDTAEPQAKPKPAKKNPRQPAQPPKVGNRQPAQPPKIGNRQPPKIGNLQPAQPPKVGNRQPPQPPKVGNRRPSIPPKADNRRPPIPAIKPKSRFDVTTKATPQEPRLESAKQSEIVVKPDQSDHILDDIISSIDQEIGQTFEQSPMGGLVSDRRTSRDTQAEQFVIFRLAGNEYAASAASIREVGEIIDLTPMPNVPDWLQGVTNLRGDVLSVVDLRAFLGLEQTQTNIHLLQEETLLGLDQEILIAHSYRDPAGITVGLLVDVVSDILYLPVEKITAPSAPIEDQVAPYLQGVYEEEERFLVVLNFEKLLLSPEMKQFEPV